MPAIEINRWMDALCARLQACRQRQLVWLQGPRDWCDRQLAELGEHEGFGLLLSNREWPHSAIAFSKAERCLGAESRLVVLDLFSGFNPDVLCIAAGLVRDGGVLLLLAPRPEDWDTSHDPYACWQDQRYSPEPRFVEYFFDALRREPGLGLVLTPDAPAPELPELAPLEPTAIVNGQTPEQAALLRQLETWLVGGKPGIALIGAARGRGKSSCLGLLAARAAPATRLLVTASSRAAAAQLLRRAPAAEFVAPDLLLQTAPAAELLIVDEAATIPLPMLRQLCRIYPRLVLATTSGGYEGTGRGFMLRFVAGLEADQLQHYRLQAPVRWCAGDRLEAWLDDTLMLDTETALPDADAARIDACELRLIAAPGARESWPLLRQVYRLLCAAHYRSRPSDLRMLMENPDQLLWVAELGGQVVGVAWLNREGGFDAELCEQVYLGCRRPRGHLLAQMLTAQAGLQRFAARRGLRVQRIAVIPALRRRGLGSRLLEAALIYAREQRLGYVGASFALDPDTALFWRQAGFELAHVSFAQGKSSGDHSIAVLQPLEAATRKDLEILRRRIRRQLPVWMTQFLRYLDAAQVSVLLRLAEFDAELDQHEYDEVRAFARGNRGFELGFASLQKFVMARLAQSRRAPEPLLVEKAVQNRDWRRLAREPGAGGRKQLQRRLREQVAALLEDA